MKLPIKFILIIMLSHFLSYYIAGFIAQLVLGAKEFHSPSSTSLIYLKDPHVITHQFIIPFA